MIDLNAVLAELEQARTAFSAAQAKARDALAAVKGDVAKVEASMAGALKSFEAKAVAEVKSIEADIKAHPVRDIAVGVAAAAVLVLLGAFVGVMIHGPLH